MYAPRETGNVLYHNAPNFAHIFGGMVAQTIATAGWDVVCAPRPLANVWWTPDGPRQIGEYHVGPKLEGYLPDGYSQCGVFFVAGPAEARLDARGERTLGDAWRSDDAWRVELIDNAGVIAKCDAYLEADGYSIAEYRAVGLDYPDVARDLGLPWRAE